MQRLDESTFQVVIRLHVRGHPSLLSSPRLQQVSLAGSHFFKKQLFSVQSAFSFPLRPLLGHAGLFFPLCTFLLPLLLLLTCSSFFVPIPQVFCPPQDHLPRLYIYQNLPAVGILIGAPLCLASRDNMTRSRMWSRTPRAASIFINHVAGHEVEN